ncbi:aromatic ring-hydroxylating dioxygenase subunit alpha [Sphingobium sp.]|uniref:aromatic ring-hydroxylating oxygenase subunit alpha n=1 Tax=Sphingobium sp. TaxID=1912891 RepID=UPI002B9E2008|nr:aromatic ring-hydroxylating dioxygenase subunit alpha [Sphingobium sp.]HUD93519.1 aromatic ring-hydroxylating dioxygenase subunit alpha [Sphingobium sp.]
MADDIATMLPLAEPDAEATARRTQSHYGLRRRTLERMRSKTTDMDVAPMRIDPRLYTDPVYFERERKTLFRETPILAALSMDIPEPGNMMVFDALGPSILITRDKEGKVNAFLNMCMHRAAKLVTECSKRTRMTCRFHAWTYDLQGKLIGLPGKEGFEGIDKANLGLIPIPVAEWKGMIFVRGTPNGAPIDVADHLGDFGDELAALELHKARPMAASRLECEANWKYAYDTYGESYHFASLHPTTIGALAFSNIMVYDKFDNGHCRLGFPREEFMDYADQNEAEWPHTDYGGLYMLFPNVSINVNSMKGGGQFYGISRVFPGETVDRSFSLLNTYQPAHTSRADEGERWKEIHDFIEHVVSTEDYSVSADGQANLNWAPDGFCTTLWRNEIALQHFHRRLAGLMEHNW